MYQSRIPRWPSAVSIAALVACSNGPTRPSNPVLGHPVLPQTSGLSQSLQSDHVATACSPHRFPSNESFVGCCQDGMRTWSTIGGQSAAFKVYDAPACREDDGIGTNCGIGSEPFKPCAYGPCGGRFEWRVTARAAHIFQPVSQSEKCGWQVAGVTVCLTGCDWPAGATRSNPEPYTDQVTHPGLTGTRPYRRCLRGGTPAQ